ncbi:hypothetical protein [Variibacter gotjawalensis]|uniref:hypothetical protein n=1 Tax=Variibacter gotjawalensis TaxID=1333996 RepID=UPI00102AE2DA|nr:hypothetical protein [Variibacter gotjawalensis]NIK47874.1 hypothetical protein [Variibacter gotjawalensis]
MSEDVDYWINVAEGHLDWSHSFNAIHLSKNVRACCAKIAARSVPDETLDLALTGVILATDNVTTALADQQCGGNFREVDIAKQQAQLAIQNLRELFSKVQQS